MNGTKSTLTGSFATVFNANTVDGGTGTDGPPLPGFTVTASGAEVEVKTTYKTGTTTAVITTPVADGATVPFPAPRPSKDKGVLKVEVRNLAGATSGYSFFSPWQPE